MHHQSRLQIASAERSQPITETSITRNPAERARFGVRSPFDRDRRFRAFRLLAARPKIDIGAACYRSEKAQIPNSAGESAGKSAGKKGTAGGSAGNSAVPLVFPTKPSCHSTVPRITREIRNVCKHFSERFLVSKVLCERVVFFQWGSEAFWGRPIFIQCWYWEGMCFAYKGAIPQPNTR